MPIIKKIYPSALRVVILLWIVVYATHLHGAKIAGVTRIEADSLGRETVLYDGLPVTFNTLSRDLLKKVSGASSYRGLTAEQTVASIRLFPVEWKDEPLIFVKDKALRDRLGAKGKHISLSSLFDAEGSYKVTTLYAGATPKETRAIEELDEKAGILLGIISGELIMKDDKIKLPEWRVNLELFYNRVPFLKILFMLLFTGSFAAGAWFIWSRFNSQESGRKLFFFCASFLSVAFLVSLVNFILEWILADRIPLSNTGETLSFTVLVGTGLTLFLLLLKGGGDKTKGEKSIGVYILGMLFWGCVALVSWILGDNPVVTPLMPALQSPWLSIHVTLVMISYALLALTFVIALIGMISPKGGEMLRKECMVLLDCGVWFLVAGIVTGSIWAKDAWGAYWSWDPKETWALITLIAYSLPLVGRLRGRWLYVYLSLAFFTVLMTYFGVNYFLGGKHSYV